MTLSSLILLGLLVLIAGFVDAIAGGGGLITIPAYLNYGITERYLLGTNKLSSTIGTFAATIKYLSELKFKRSYLIIILCSSAIFSSSGAFLISAIPSYLIKIIIICVIPPLSIYLISKKNFATVDRTKFVSKKKLITLSLINSSICSFYDGLLGPGTGSFLATGYSIIGYDILSSTALAKFTNLISNISALITFLILGRVDIKTGIFMGFLSLIGNYAGAHIALKKGVFIIKPVLIIVSNIILLKVIIDLLK
ncbi:MAG: TSUP family transporter [Elusimicrobiales bacterium]|nr:TSUP family transporter [Elusimicrobiales bacterium]